MSSTDPNLGLNYGWTLGESGWLFYIEDETKLSAYKSTGWSAGIAI